MKNSCSFLSTPLSHLLCFIVNISLVSPIFAFWVIVPDVSFELPPQLAFGRLNNPTTKLLLAGMKEAKARKIQNHHDTKQDEPSAQTSLISDKQYQSGRTTDEKSPKPLAGNALKAEQESISVQSEKPKPLGKGQLASAVKNLPNEVV